jgi:hypothetical protein
MAAPWRSWSKPCPAPKSLPNGGAPSMFWFIILVLVVAIVGVSVLVGRSLSRSSGRPLSRQEKLNALKASGAMPNRKESRN